MIKFGALPENINHFLPDVREYLNKHPKVVFAYLFGGLARGRVSPLSDADIANHIISDRGYRTPDSYGDTFRVLHENGVIKDDLLEIMLKMARFRNIVVHQYDKVDEAIVIGILRNNLDDFTAYRDTILRVLDL